jgi:hypothetical protein
MLEAGEDLLEGYTKAPKVEAEKQAVLKGIQAAG